MSAIIEPGEGRRRKLYFDHGRLVMAGAESIGPEPRAPVYAGWWIAQVIRADGKVLWRCDHIHHLPEEAADCAERRIGEQYGD